MSNVFNIKTGKPLVFAPPVNIPELEASMAAALASETNASLELEAAIKAAAKVGITYVGETEPKKDFAKYAPQYRDFKGSKYDKALTTVEIAARIRTDIKAAVKAGELPALKYSVKKDHHKAIDITLANAPFGILDETRVLNDAKGLPANGSYWMSAEARKVKEAVEALANAYNYDRSDPMTDYFDVGFYLSVDYSGDTDAERTAILAKNGLDAYGRAV